VARLSAGLLVYRLLDGGGIEVLLVHPGGPLWAAKDAGAWSIPKGEYAEHEDARARAEVEFAEELGRSAPAGERLCLGEVRQAGGKRVQAWAVEGDVDTASAHSNTFDMEWPRRSGVMRSFPEVDRAEWFTVEEAATRLLAGQRPLLERLVEQLSRDDAGGGAGR
jgi:predicted NUDIX family NTP pyrophosphohydrolase